MDHWFRFHLETNMLSQGLSSLDTLISCVFWSCNDKQVWPFPEYINWEQLLGDLNRFIHMPFNSQEKKSNCPKMLYWCHKNWENCKPGGEDCVGKYAVLKKKKKKILTGERWIEREPTWCREETEPDTRTMGAHLNDLQGFLLSSTIPVFILKQHFYKDVF